MLFHPAFHAERDAYQATILACIDILPDFLGSLDEDELDRVITVIHTLTGATMDLIKHDYNHLRILDALNTGLARQLAASDNDPKAGEQTV